MTELAGLYRDNWRDIALKCDFVTFRNLRLVCRWLREVLDVSRDPTVRDFYGRMIELHTKITIGEKGETVYLLPNTVRREKHARVVDITGSIFWFINNQLHRNFDLPAVIHSDGMKVWCKNNLRHRDGDLPAYISKNIQQYFKEGKLHREGGPANIISTRDDRDRIITQKLVWLRYGIVYNEGFPAIINYKLGSDLVFSLDATEAYIYKDGKLVEEIKY